MLVKIFFIVLGINVLPAFGPPTWIVLTYFQITHGLNVFLLALVGTVAATLGRIILARFAKRIIRNKFLSERTKTNINVIKTRLTEHRRMTIGISLLYSFTPLPSNQLFLAYGLTDLPLLYMAVPDLAPNFRTERKAIILEKRRSPKWNQNKSEEEDLISNLRWMQSV
jgi:hypothetical protein